MLNAKIDLLMERMDDLTNEKDVMATTTQTMDSRMTCEVCGNTRHSGNHCPYRPQGGQTWNQPCPYYQGGNQGNSFNPNQPSLKDLVYVQAKINESFNKKTVVYDKTLDNLNIKINGHSSALKNQLSFNKMIETHLSQIVVLVPLVENAKAVVTRGGGKTTHDPPYPNQEGTSKKRTREVEESSEDPFHIRE
jgi:hypothetical protein